MCITQLIFELKYIIYWDTLFDALFKSMQTTKEIIICIHKFEYQSVNILFN